MCCWVAHHRFLLFYPRSVSGRSLEGAPPSSRTAGASGTVVRGWGLAVADRVIRPSSRDSTSVSRQDRPRSGGGVGRPWGLLCASVVLGCWSGGPTDHALPSRRCAHGHPFSRPFAFVTREAG